MPTFKVSPTSYELVQQVYNKISSENGFFKNPNASQSSTLADVRFVQKYNESTSIYYPLLDKYKNYSSKISGKFSEVLSNMFLKPNVHQENERTVLHSIRDNLNLMADLINEGRYNSAIDLGKNISMQFSDLDKALVNNPLPEQKIDWFTIIIILLVIVAIIYFAIKSLS